ncbi:hypothetical protein N2152v2_007895 [Parachlorella kessleri]
MLSKIPTESPSLQAIPDLGRLQQQARPERRPRYLVAEQQALDLLEKSVHRTPLITPSAQGPKTRFLKLPPAQVCSKVLSSAAREPKLVARAAELADILLVQGVQLDPQTLHDLVLGLTRRGKVALALPPLDRWLQHHADTLEEEEEDRGIRADALHLMTGLVDAAARAEDTKMLRQVLVRMARVGLMPRPQSITGILQCFMRLSQPHIAHSILEWMRRGGLQPTIAHYTSLLAVPRDLDPAADARLLVQAKSSYAQMLEEDVHPNARFYTAYIRLCGRAHDVREALDAWNDMQAQGIPPDLVLYSAFLDACAKCHSPEMALQLYEAMLSQQLQPDVAAYSTLLTALQGPPPHLAAARQVWAAMSDAGVQPNATALGAYLDILLGEIDEALELLTNATQQPSRHAAGASAQLLRLYEHFMLAMALKGQHEVVSHLARHLKAQGLSHTAVTAAALLTSQAMQRGVANGRWLLLPSAEGQAPGGGLALGQLNVLLGGLVVQGHPKEAFELYDWAQLEGLRPNAWTFRLLMCAALNAPTEAQFELLTQVLADSRQVGADRTIPCLWQHASGGGQQRRRGGSLWCQRTRHAVLGAMRQSNKARELLGDAEGHFQSSEESDAKMQQVLAMLGRR